ncbi:MAG: GIY-YIG nuclease family protein [Promethearchaeota archaeon]
MAHGKVVSLFLVTGDPRGLKKVEIKNRSTQAFAVYKNDIKALLDRKEVRKPGIYFLIGKDEGINKFIFYIGETEDIRTRLKDHMEKEFWSQCIVFTSKDELLNKAHVKWLESNFYKELYEAKQVILENKNTPGGAKVSEDDEAVLEEFKEDIVLVLGTLGFVDINKQEEIIPQSNELSSIRNIIYKLRRKEIEARMIPKASGYLVLKGSELLPETTKYREDPSVKSSYILRDRLLNENKIKESNGKLILTEDYLFNSPTAGAQFLIGKSVSGRVEWVTEQEGTSLKEIEKKLLS